MNDENPKCAFCDKPALWKVKTNPPTDQNVCEEHKNKFVQGTVLTYIKSIQK